MKAKKIAALFAAMILTLTLASCASSDSAVRKAKKLYANGSYSECLTALQEIDRDGLKKIKEEEVWHIMGNCCMQLGKYEEAVKYQTNCVKLNPEHFLGWVNLGVAYRKLGDNEAAFTSYETALKYDTGLSAPFYISLGAMYIERGKPVSAADYLEKAKTLNPGKPDTYAYLAIAYKMSLEPEKSDEALQKAEQMGYPNMDGIREQLAKINK